MSIALRPTAALLSMRPLRLNLSIATGLAAALLLTSIAPVAAQDANATRRIDKLEREMRAVQRQVFPGGNPAFFEPDIAPDAAAPVRGPTATPPSAELNGRLDALEGQLQALTGQSEQNGFKLRELERQFSAFKASVEARLAKLEAAAAAPAAIAASAAVTTPAAAVAASAPAARPAAPAATVRPPAAATPAPATAQRPNAERLARVKAVEVPGTGNAAEDGYNYGYRLWEAKLYPEAQAQLKTVVEKHGSHRLASFAQNLLGRAYLDEGKPSLAAVAFYNNYKDRPNGERAPHSLMYMGIALDRLGRKADACKAFKEFDDVYGTRAPQSVQSEAAAAKQKAGC